jgi:hypothetical protein
VSAVTLLLVLVLYSRRSIRVNGLRPSLWIWWIVFFLGTGLTGFLEWLVNRHLSWHLSCYFLMSLSTAAMAFAVYRAYLTICAEKKKSRRSA